MELNMTKNFLPERNEEITIHLLMKFVLTWLNKAIPVLQPTCI